MKEFEQLTSEGKTCNVCGKEIIYCKKCGQELECYERDCKYCLPCHDNTSVK